MKAAWYEKFGDADEVLIYGDFETPVPKKHEVLVRIYASGINPSDVKKRAGVSPSVLDAGPVIPHSDGAGIIEAVGSDVDKARVGEQVWIYNAQYGRQHGTAAEYIALNSNQAVSLPENTSFEVGACMGIPAMTAHRCITADGSVSGQSILITGGSGRVGYYVIQWAKIFGATVIATAGSEVSRKHCSDAGADFITKHPCEDASKEIMEFTNGEGVDRIIEGDFGYNLTNTLDLIKTNGTIATYASMTNPNPEIPFYRMMFKDITIRLVLVYAMPENAILNATKDISEYLEKDKLMHRISDSLPLSEIAKGHRLIEEGNCLGCVVLKCG
jgi:NADPH2:quinone reductase